MYLRTCVRVFDMNVVYEDMRECECVYVWCSSRQQAVVVFADSAGTVAKKRLYSVVVPPKDPYHHRRETQLVCR